MPRWTLRFNPTPADRFSAARPVATSLELTASRGETPKVEGRKLTSGAGSSLAEDQSRILRIGGIGKLRPDGVKEILQLQYSPQGTRRLLLSEEAPIDGGQGRAPDANTLISAGLGFCFMTQFGRFATIMKKQLDRYRILQHTHFSPGRDPGRPGVTDPVETHVYLDSSEAEDVARTVLDMSEQTCFLHALCRTPTETRVTVVD